MDKKKFLKLEEEKVELVKDGVLCIEETVYRVFDDGTKEFACSASYPKPSEEKETQLTSAEQQEAREAYIMAMMEN